MITQLNGAVAGEILQAIDPTDLVAIGATHHAKMIYGPQAIAPS